METTSNPELFEPNVNVTSDGRTRGDEEDQGRLEDIYDTLPGKGLKQQKRR